MKKTTLLSLFFAIVTFASIYATTIPVEPTEDLKAILRAAKDGDVIILTSADVYVMDSIKNINSVTIQAAPGLDAKPVIRCLQDQGVNGKTQFYPKGGGSLTLDGIAFDGNNSIYFWCTSQYEGLANVTVNNCDFFNMKSPAGTGGVIFVSKKFDTASGMATVAGSLRVTNCSFERINQGIMSSTSASFSAVSFKNCSVKGPLKAEAFGNTTTKPETYEFDHVTFNGCNFREFSITSSTSITVKNVILANNNLANNTTGTKGTLLLGSGNLVNKCGVFNYSPTCTSYTNANTITVDPKFDANGIATATEYVAKGTDNLTIGYYDNGQIRPAATAISSIYKVDFKILQSEHYITIQGIENSSKYQLFSVAGKQLENGIINTNGKIDTNTLQSGIYFLRINNQTAKFAVK